MLDSEIGTVATNFNIPNRITYITTICPANDPDKNYLFGGGSYTLIGMEYENHKYGYQFATCGGNLPGTKHRALNKGIWSNWETYVTNTDLDTRLPTYYSLNGVTKIKNLPYGIYNLGNSDILKLTDKPSELAGGRCLLITSGASSYDEKVALILASTHQSGGIYFGHIWGTSVNEFAWKKVIGNA